MRLLSALLDRSAKRRMVSELLLLDDHLLRDIGLNRHDLRASLRPRAATGPVIAHA